MNGSAPPPWQQVASLKPRLHAQVRTFRHVYRGERWYVLQAPVSGKYLRVNAIAYDFIARLNGQLSVKSVLAHPGNSGPTLTEADAVQLLIQLTQAELISGGIPAGFDLPSAGRNRERAFWVKALLSPLSIRLPLFNPDGLLSVLERAVRPFMSPWLVGLWLLLLGSSAVMALGYSREIAVAFSSHFLKPDTAGIAAILYVLIKALHELGHGLVLKAWGGRVQEMGIALLFFLPVPYVDGSDTWSLPDKRKRAAVAAAGVWFELSIAAIFFNVWLLVEPGFMHDLALQVMLIGGLSTLLFNGNPLLRYDGYYVLEDLIEIPNLARRAGEYWLYLAQRHLFGSAQARSPISAPGERNWFLCYGAAATIYRLVLMFTVAFFLAEQYVVVGAALAAWSLLNQAVLPLWRALAFVVKSPKLIAVRKRAMSVTAAGMLLITVVVALVPIPLRTSAEGYVWLPEQGQVFTEQEGFVARVLPAEGARVHQGDQLVQLDNPELTSRVKVLEARLRELHAQALAERQSDRVRESITNTEIVTVQEELEVLRRQVAKLSIKSPSDGVFLLPTQKSLLGQYLKRGEPVAYVVAERERIVRTVVDQGRIGLFRAQVEQVQVRLAERPDRVLSARILREVPGGSLRLPHRVLGVAGGGQIAVDPSDISGMVTSARVFQIDLSLPAEYVGATLGGRVYVRFDHGSEPLAVQCARSLRQLFLSRLQV